jgi:serine/threonine-protein kinase
LLALLEEMLDSGKTPEEACRDCPELLPEIRRRWQDYRMIDAHLGAMLPGLQTVPDIGRLGPSPHAGNLPEIPGYAVEAPLGHGAMGVVYKARHLALKRTVAIKMIAFGHPSPAERARFRAEAEAVARLQHPNIVQIHEVGEADGRPFIALEYVAGGSLAVRLARKSLAPLDAAHLVAALAEAMNLAHSRNLVHRDLKPGNVLLAGDANTPIGLCQPKVTDFGLVRQLDADSGQTLDGMVMGTPRYMAPEQAQGLAHSAGPAADVYALGAILYECLTGRPPFEGATTLETLEQVRTCEPAAPSSLNRQVSRDLETICLKCLRKEPERRYSSARELADDLGRFARGEPVSARPVGMAERLGKWAKRRPAAAGLLAAVVILVSAGGAGGWLLSQQRAMARSRQALTGQEVHRVMQQAQAKLKAGWQTHDLATLTEARIQADQAAGVAHNGGASPEDCQDASAFQSEAAVLLERARKNRELMDAVLEISTLENMSQKTNAAGELVNRTADEQYADAFRRWGQDIDGTADADVIARLGAEPEVVQKELIAALDSWTLWRRQYQNQAAGWQRLYWIAEQLDHSERRRRLRELLVGRSTPRPEELAGAMGAASPWWALWELTRGAWRQLQVARQETDSGAEPGLTVVLLADACQAMGDPAGAEQALRQALTAQPDQVVLITRLARLLETQGPSRFGEAIGYYRAAHALRSTMSRSLCFAMLRLGRYEEAEEFCREMIRRQPDNQEFHRILCMTLISHEKWSQLEDASLKLIDLKPNLALAHTALGLALAGQKRSAEAEKAHRNALSFNPEYEWAYNNLGLTLMDQGKSDEAAAAFHKALEFDPKLAYAYVNLGYLRSRQGRYGEALQFYRKAVDLEPDAVAFAGLGSALANHLQDYAGAEAAYRKAIALRPTHPMANFGLGIVLMRQGKQLEAVECFRLSLLQNSGDVQTTRNLCRALIALGRGEEACVAWRPILDAHLNEPEFWYGYPELCLFLGRNDEYDRLRAACLRRFATSTDPVTAVRTGRACLILPGTEDELRMASTLSEVAAASRKREHESLRPYIVFTKGLADFRRGRLDSAIVLMEGEASGVWGPAPDLVVAMAKHRLGRMEDAWRAFTMAILACDWSVARSDNIDAWICHVLRREAESMLLPTLPAFLQGTYQPQLEDERLALLAARLALYEVQGLRGSVAGLYSELLRAEPKLGEALAKGGRLYAARAVALAGCGKGIDADQLDDKERGLRRRQALEWLRQDLTAWSDLAAKNDAQSRALVRVRMRALQTDYDLACLRASDALARLSAEEQQQWEKFWSDVNALLQRVGAE